MIWPQIKKIIVLKCHLLLFYTKIMNHFSIGLWHVIKSGFYTTIGDDQLSGWTEKKFQSTYQSQTCTSQTHYNFLNPGETITSVKYAQQVDYYYYYYFCSWHWSTERAQLSSTTILDHTLHSQCFKSWTNWAMKFCLICHIHLISCQLTTTSSSILTTFCRENASTISKRQKMLSKSSLNPEAWIFTLQE